MNTIASHKYHHLKSHFLQLQRVSLSIAVRRERATCLIQMQSNLQATHSLNTHTLRGWDTNPHTFLRIYTHRKKKILAEDTCLHLWLGVSFTVRESHFSIFIPVNRVAFITATLAGTLLQQGPDSALAGDRLSDRESYYKDFRRGAANHQCGRLCRAGASGKSPGD